MTEKALLEELFDSTEPYDIWLKKLRSIGRTMPFGKYKGEPIVWLLTKHRYYMDWIVNNTQFKLNDLEKWWKDKVDTFVAIKSADRVILGVARYVGGCIESYIETNPHVCVE